MRQKSKMDIYKDFKKIFNVKTEPETEYIKLDDRKIFLDSANVCGIIPKRIHLLNFLKENFDLNKDGGKIPELNYTTKGSELVLSRYSGEYLRNVLEICKHYKSVKFSIRKDYPLSIETEDFIYILAPRIGED